MDLPIETATVDAEAYPFVVEYLNAVGEVVETQTVEGPGVLKVPGLSVAHGPIGVRITWGDPAVEEIPPP
jgi:hypothetical protein